MLTASVVAAIPAELKSIPHWVTWRYETRKGDKTKVPFTTGTNQRASSTNSSTWSNFDVALAGMNGFDGLGWVATKDAAIVLIDLDHTGADQIAVWAQRILERVPSYAERSPSGSGIHIMARATLPPGKRKCGRLEMYDEKKIFHLHWRPHHRHSSDHRAS